MQGTVSKTTAGYEARLSLLLKHETDEVWAALTEPETLSKWLAVAEIELVLGGKLQLHFNNTDSIISGNVIAIAPYRLLEFTWGSAGSTSMSLVRWELLPQVGGTQLMLTHTLSDYHGLPEMLAGWHTHLEGLPTAMHGQQVPWPWERWHQLHALYQQQIRAYLER